jgi:hypothetical protein
MAADSGAMGPPMDGGTRAHYACPIKRRALNQADAASREEF